ncbi:hypothetical protein [Marininema mesophilum]|uniref:hypothetical protein n=1 Tax=Marininema mesophilum TaxID=1048340 RepID=UPI00115FE685|nr:hypothetical protein [Marininema mesophilum]
MRSEGDPARSPEAESKPVAMYRSVFLPRTALGGKILTHFSTRIDPLQERRGLSMMVVALFFRKLLLYNGFNV